MTIANAVYLQDLKSLSGDAGEVLVRTLGPSAYNVVILAFLHPHSPWDLYFSGKRMYRQSGGRLVATDPILIATLAGRIERLRSEYKPLKNVLLSIGPFESDYDCVASDVPAFVDNLYTVARQLHLDGYDFDYEGRQDARHQELLAELARRYSDRVFQEEGRRPAITAAPFAEPEWWRGVLERSRTDSGSSFSWFNVQLYGADTNPAPEEAAGLFEAWESAVAAAGIDDPSGFLVPGVNADRTVSPVFGPRDLSALVETVHAQFPEVGGGFAWSYREVSRNLSAWANAVPSVLTAQANARQTV